MTKSVAYAYPTSPDAVHFGFGKEGCYTVNIHLGIGEPAQAVAGYATKAEAVSHTDEMECPTNRYCLTHQEP